MNNKKNKKIFIIIIIANFYMRFSHEAQSAYRGSPTPDRAVNSIECAELRGCLTSDVKICTYNVKFGLF